MPAEEFARATIERAWEPPEEVVIPLALAYDPVLQPEDYGVLIRLLLRDPGKPAGVARLAKEFQESGWKMSDSRLRGVMARLKKAGHVSHRRNGYDQVSGRPKWAFAVYRNPANNPQYVQAGTDAASQVRPTRGNPTSRAQTAGRDALDSNVYAGQADTLDSNVSHSDTLDFNALDSNVYAGQADTLDSNGCVPSPPHPPEEVTTSSPYPLTDTSGLTGVPSPREEGEGAGYPEADLRAAADVLEVLPAPWTQGRLNAGKLAPKLLAVMSAQGWPDIHTVDRALLVQQLTKNPHKISNPYRLLAGDRIPNLPRYAVVSAEAEAARPPGATSDGMCPKHPTYRAGNRCIPCLTA